MYEIHISSFRKDDLSGDARGYVSVGDRPTLTI